MKVDYFKSALLHHSKGNWNKAREIYEHILKTNPNNYSVLQNYGPLLSQLKEFALAKNVFDQFDSAVKERNSKGLLSDTTFVGINSADIKDHKQIITKCK